MADYREHFGFYADQILRQLYGNFPVAVEISSDDLLGKRIEIEKYWELQREETTVRDMIEVLENTGHIDEATRQNARDKLEVLNRDIQVKRDEISVHRKILDGTRLFLQEEGYIRCDGYERYQLTEKGLSHLGKSFSDNSIKK